MRGNKNCGMSNVDSITWYISKPLSVMLVVAARESGVGGRLCRDRCCRPQSSERLDDAMYHDGRGMVSTARKQFWENPSYMWAVIIVLEKNFRWSRTMEQACWTAKSPERTSALCSNLSESQEIVPHSMALPVIKQLGVELMLKQRALKPEGLEICIGQVKHFLRKWNINSDVTQMVSSIEHSTALYEAVAAVAEQLACSPHTNANRVQFPGRVTPRFSHVGIMLGDAASGRVFSGFSRFPRNCIPAPLHPRVS
ncbi:hypothetical protein PR048_032298 [Dryococelus australis]|uniref:Uncharacterized protein n=1 Tax=Dryococelus australis TaxID=614101 RepID=A0ABQ9G1U8_9NEOP|nr:hypothetical protein PR048_032298 [Dryococelus australis]